MDRIMFDTNAFDRLIPKLALVSIFEKQDQSDRHEENSITLEQAAEIADISDKKERENKFLEICSERPYLKGGLSNFFESTANHFQYYITHIQVEELANISNKSLEKREKRICNFIVLCSMRPQMIPTMFVLGVTKLGHGCPGSDKDEEVFDGIKTEQNNSVHDAIIGAAAQNQGMTVVTNDDRFIKRLNEENIPNISSADWLDSLF